ncbi:hypothetical protein PENSUB_6862 [Penicillium subrubescens]|uniref:Uncharacterized protein n=1 Tax=Penicillium subrubescens TaxID=1316194 RepID=A0A1Q5TT08_9EURO|nr:hypothetical protein PENSUB_6862 [Penicillium subrubescens]
MTLDTGMSRSVPFGSGLDGNSELQTAAGRRGGGGTRGRKRKVDAVTDDGGDAAKATKTAKNAQTAKTTGGDGGAGSNATTSSAPFDSSAAQVANAKTLLTGLDSRNNPLKSAFTSVAEKALLAVAPVRDVDWRDSAKPLNTSSQRRAAYVQQNGLQAPSGSSCAGCGLQKGPFKSCCVFVVGGDLAFRGACGNCSFNSGGTNCSLRFSSIPDWIRPELAAQNPDHPALKDPSILTPVKRRAGRVSETPALCTTTSAPTGATGSVQAAPHAVAVAPSTPPTVLKSTAAPVAPRSAAAPVAPKPKGTDAAKAAAAGAWKNAWLTSPLGDPAVQDPNDSSVALAAFNALPEMVARLHSDRNILGKYLVSKGVIKPEDVPMNKKEEKKEEEKKNPFLDFV